MGLFKRIFGKSDSSPRNKKDDTGMVNLAFVLLSEEHVPQPQKIIDAFGDFAEADQGIQLDQSEEDDDEPAGSEDTPVLLFKHDSGERSFVAFMPCAVPNGEAEEGVQFSLSSFRDDWKLPPHCAHLLVTQISEDESSPVEQLSRFTSIVAAVAKASPSVGVYWGNAGATHDSDFFISVASEQGVTSRMMLWTGVSIARERDGRPSILSLGMKQLNLPDLLLVVGQASANRSMETMFDLLVYLAKRGEPIPEGETVGRTAQEKLPVRYVRSPIDPNKKVWRVELP